STTKERNAAERLLVRKCGLASTRLKCSRTTSAGGTELESGSRNNFSIHWFRVRTGLYIIAARFVTVTTGWNPHKTKDVTGLGNVTVPNIERAGAIVSV